MGQLVLEVWGNLWTQVDADVLIPASALQALLQLLEDESPVRNARQHDSSEEVAQAVTTLARKVKAWWV
jgi:hypothetical protein